MKVAMSGEEAVYRQRGGVGVGAIGQVPAEESARATREAQCTGALPAEYPAEYLEPRWYAAYTSANHEKRVAEQLKVRSVGHFLPLYPSVRRWKDRRVTLEMPLFPGYVFVHLALRDRLRVLQIPGLARLVGFNGTPTALPDGEIEALRAGFEGGMRAEPHPFLTAGRRVRVTSGPLAGLPGILVRRRKQTRFVVSLELIQRSVAVEVDEGDLAPE